MLTKDQLIVHSLALFMQSPAHREWYLKDLNTYLFLPIKHNRMRLYLKGEEPIGLITWCWMYPEDAQEFLLGNYHPSEEDFENDSLEGKELWGLEFIAPSGHAREINRLIREEIKDTYGPQFVNWRRFHSRDIKRTKRFG